MVHEWRDRLVASRLFSLVGRRGDIHVCTRASIDNERRLREGSLYPESHNCSPFSARTSLINQSSPMAFRPLFRRAATEKQPPSMPARRTSPTSNSNSFLSLLLPPPHLSLLSSFLFRDTQRAANSD